MSSWFNKKDINIEQLINNKIFNENIRGYILPHAGTKYTGNILSHTLRFYPNNFFNSIIILYYPANDKENIIIDDNKYFHEYYVLWKTLEYVNNKIWKYGKKLFMPINVRDLQDLHSIEKIINKNTLNTSLIISSVDFSHFLNLQTALLKENCAVHAIIHKNFDPNLECLKVVDDNKTIELMYKLLPKDNYLQWIGRTRSNNEKGVGYLSFLIKQPQKHFVKPDGIFVTAYDINMKTRECLGEWFSKIKKYNKSREKQLIDKVIKLAKSTSRLTNGDNLHIPVKYYTITYLYHDTDTNKTTNKTVYAKIKNKIHKKFKTRKINHRNDKNHRNDFIRGYHGILSDAFFLSDVMLENVFNNGKWITHNDTVWPQNNKFDLTETLSRLSSKAGKPISNNNEKLFDIHKIDYKLYYSDVTHKTIP